MPAPYRRKGRKKAQAEVCVQAQSAQDAAEDGQQQQQQQQQQQEEQEQACAVHGVGVAADTDIGPGAAAAATPAAAGGDDPAAAGSELMEAVPAAVSTPAAAGAPAAAATAAPLAGELEGSLAQQVKEACKPLLGSGPSNHTALPGRVLPLLPNPSTGFKVGAPEGHVGAPGGEARGLQVRGRVPGRGECKVHGLQA